MLYENEPVIGEHNYVEHVRPIVDGVPVRGGLKPRDWKKHPRGSYANGAIPAAVDIPLIQESEWSQRIRDQAEQKRRISDIRMTYLNGSHIPSLDQNGQGYCWCYSGASAWTLMRAVQNQKYVRPSPHANACKIKNFRDQGGWGAHGMEFLVENGIPSEEFWPQKSMSRSYDKPETWENAKKHRVTEGWWDLSDDVYDRNLSWAQVVTLCLCCIPMSQDFNWWGHSVCGMDVVDGSQQRSVTRSSSGKLMSLQEFDIAWGMDNPVTRGLGNRIWNSWADSYGTKGMGVLTGNKAIPDGCTAIRSVQGSAA